MNALIRRLVAFLRGRDSGQSFVEYMTIVGACALVGIAGFSRYGKAVKSDLSANAKHIEGEGLPTTEGLLGSLGADYNEVPGWCVKPNYCFTAGTPVQTERGDRSIESIRVGDRVWARDVTTGAIALRSVLNTYRTARVAVIDLELSVGRVSSEHLGVTRGHLFWVEGPGWVRADALGALPLWSTERATEAQIPIAQTDTSPELTTVYNLEVSEFHSYFVGHSHVLVHNGDPESSGCPDPPAPSLAIPRPTRPRGTKLQCGDTGSYYDELGGWDRDLKRTSRDSNGLQRDHIPSTAALQYRAKTLMAGLAARMADSRCRELTDSEQQALATAQADAAARLDTEALYDGFAVMEPLSLHKEGRTFGNKNKDLYEHDSHDLDTAAQKDAEELLNQLNSQTVPDPVCLAAIRAALQKIGGRTQDEYDHELGTLAQSLLELSGFNKIVQDTCDGHDLQTESRRN